MRATGEIEVPGARLRYETAGSGSPVLLLHAAVTDRRMWEPVVPALVDAGLRPIWYDLRGFGESPTEDVEFSPRADLIAVLDALDLSRVVVAGNSRGGLIALDAALEYPERILWLIHIGAFMSGLDRATTPAEAVLFEAMQTAHRAGDALAEARIDARLWLDGPTAAQGRVGGEVREAFISMDLPNCASGRVEGRPVPLNPPADERLGELRIPVLAVVGDWDLVAAQAAAERLESAVTRAHRVVVPGVGHLMPLEAPDVTARLIAEFVTSA